MSAGFARTALEMPPRELEQLRIEQELAGERRRFPWFRSASGLLASVARIRGAIGYLDASLVSGRDLVAVKVIRVIEGGRVLRPFDRGYPLAYDPAPDGDLP